MSKGAKPSLVELNITAEMVRDVILAWERNHPGALDRMSPKDFSDLLMKKIEATAQIVEGGNA
jgi:hypothetical protein